MIVDLSEVGVVFSERFLSWLVRPVELGVSSHKCVYVLEALLV
jgi:hypothetical protein